MLDCRVLCTSYTRTMDFAPSLFDSSRTHRQATHDGGKQASDQATTNSATRKSKYKNKGPAIVASTALGFSLKKITFRCVMTQDNALASHKSGYTALLLDPNRGGLIGVTADHNLVLLEPSPFSPLTSGLGAPGRERVKGRQASGCLVTKRQIVGYNDEVIDMKSVPKGVLGVGSWVAVATNSPQVRYRCSNYIFVVDLFFFSISGRPRQKPLSAASILEYFY